MRDDATGLVHGAVITVLAVVGLVLSYRRGFDQAAVIAVLVVGLFCAYVVRNRMRARLVYDRGTSDRRGEHDPR